MSTPEFPGWVYISNTDTWHPARRDPEGFIVMHLPHLGMTVPVLAEYIAETYTDTLPRHRRKP